MTSERQRFPRSVYGIGHEPDPRFSLANERTFLAHIRTALAFLAGGVALEGFGLNISLAFRLTASLLLVLAGVAISAEAWRSWFRAERAIRQNDPLPAASLVLPLTVVVAVVGLLVFLGILIR